MLRRLAGAVLLGALAHAAPLVQKARRRTNAASLVSAGMEAPELLRTSNDLLQDDTVLEASWGSHGDREGVARPFDADVNEDEEDYTERTTPDIMGERVHMVGHLWNFSSGSFSKGTPAAMWYMRLRGREAHPDVITPYDVPAYEAEAWATVMYARRLGPHRHVPDFANLRGNLRAFFGSASPIDWYVLGLVLVMITAMDGVLLRHLPETWRTHVVLLIFWVLVATVFCIEIWLRLGPQAGVMWITGYVLELIFSFDNVFIVHLLFCTFEMPRRLTSKALFIGLFGSIAFRMAFLLGLASVLDRLKVIPYVMGLWLTYCGTRQVTVHEDESADVTQLAVVRTLRGILGERLGEFYDEEGEATTGSLGAGRAVQVEVQMEVSVAEFYGEEGEAIFTTSSRGKCCMTLLGVVVLCLLFVDFFLAFDVMLTKNEELPNAYLSFSSSALAMFAIRGVLLAATDVFSRFFLVKYGIGLVLLFMGAETLLSHAVYVNALLSCSIISVIVALSMLCSWLRGPCPKVMQ